jgi:hypothetical protein
MLTIFLLLLMSRKGMIDQQRSCGLHTQDTNVYADAESSAVLKRLGRIEMSGRLKASNGAAMLDENCEIRSMVQFAFCKGD